MPINNPYNIDDEDLLNTFHRETPDFDLMNLVNAELHKIAAAPCRLYKLDPTQSRSDSDDIYAEYQYRVYLPPIIVKMYYVEPTWTEELSRLGINMPEQVVFSTNLQALIQTIRNARLASTPANAAIDISYTWDDHSAVTSLEPFSERGEPDEVQIYYDGNKKLKSNVIYNSDGASFPDPIFELSFENCAGIIDLEHAAVSTADKLADFIDGLPHYSANLRTGSLDVLSVELEPMANAEDIKDATIELLIDRGESVYENVTDVLEAGDLVETFRRHEATRDAVEGAIPENDPVTGQPVRGKLYEVRYAFVANETPSWHYINYNITCDKIAMDTYETLLPGLPGDEPWTVGSGPWYA